MSGLLVGFRVHAADMCDARKRVAGVDGNGGAEPGCLLLDCHHRLERLSIRRASRVLPGDRRQQRPPVRIDEDVRVDLRADADTGEAAQIVRLGERGERRDDAFAPLGCVLLGQPRRWPAHLDRTREIGKSPPGSIDEDGLDGSRSHVDSDEALPHHPPSPNRWRRSAHIV
jgi:hypothetical protein